MRHRDLTDALEAWARPQYAYDWDPIGYQWGDPEAQCQGIILALDFSRAALDAARALGANLIVTHHPTWFKPVPNLLSTRPKDALALEAIRAGITVYSAHTNLDAAPRGVSFAYARSLFPEYEDDFTLFLPLDDEAAGASAGIGCRVELPEAWTLPRLRERCQSAWGFVPLALTTYKSPAAFASPGERAFRDLVFWGGSWDESLNPQLASRGVDALFAGEIAWHVECELKLSDISAIATGHGQSESWILPDLRKFFEKASGGALPIEIR